MAESAVNRRLRCMEDIDNNLEEIEQFSGVKDLIANIIFLISKRFIASKLFLEDVSEYRALHEVDEIDEEIDK